jgi:hypothetical protein
VLAIDPVIGALAAGCAVVLKPSEITPTVSSLLAELIPQYLDTDAIQVVEGGVPVVTALLEQKWDKIFYTGWFCLLLLDSCFHNMTHKFNLSNTSLSSLSYNSHSLQSLVMQPKMKWNLTCSSFQIVQAAQGLEG